MLTLVYSNEGMPVADYEAESRAKEIIELYKAEKIPNNLVYCSSEIFFLAMRVLGKRGLIAYDDLQFKFENKILFLDKDFQVSEWPKGFCGYYESFLCELIQWGK